jgi:hypothetical protein
MSDRQVHVIKKARTFRKEANNNEEQSTCRGRRASAIFVVLEIGAIRVIAVLRFASGGLGHRGYAANQRGRSSR